MNHDRIRLHKYIADHLSALTSDDYTKPEIDRNIETYGVTIDGVVCTKRLQWVEPWQNVALTNWPKREKGDMDAVKVLAQEPDYLVLYKPANLVVQPGAGHKHDNLVTWLLEHFPEQQIILDQGLQEYNTWKKQYQKNSDLEDVAEDQDDGYGNFPPKYFERSKDYRNNYDKDQKRNTKKEENTVSTSVHKPFLSNAYLTAGLVHRLDKDTQGVILVARSRQSLDFFQNQFRQHTVQKKYLAIIDGVIPGKIELKNWQTRSKSDPTRQKLFWSESEALHYDPQSRFAHSVITPKLVCPELNQSLIEIQIFTGRMHQIRLQCEALGFPLSYDAVYHDKATPGNLEYGTQESVTLNTADFIQKKQDIFGSTDFCLLSNSIEFVDTQGKRVIIEEIKL